MNDKSQRSRWGIFIKFSAFTLWWHLWDRFASSRIDLKSTLVENPVLAREKSTRARGLWDRNDIKSMRRYFREWSRKIDGYFWTTCVTCTHTHRNSSCRTRFSTITTLNMKPHDHFLWQLIFMADLCSSSYWQSNLAARAERIFSLSLCPFLSLYRANGNAKS